MGWLCSNIRPMSAGMTAKENNTLLSIFVIGNFSVYHLTPQGHTRSLMFYILKKMQKRNAFRVTVNDKLV